MDIITFFRGQSIKWHDQVVGQKRKYTGEPYSVHPHEVAEIYRSYFPNNSIGIAAAYGHDLLEDTPATQDNLFAEAGILNMTSGQMDLMSSVYWVIMELTDHFTSKNYPQLNRAERKRLERNRLSSTSNIARNIKICDLISNTSSIVEHDPEFAKVYLEEKAALLDVLTGTHAPLMARVRAQLVAAQAELAQMSLDKGKALNPLDKPS